ncbi:MAG: LamG domain-containing protein, partial [Anaerolineales bacterium]|nr:LamG domain-containing protein [Anaerolineales bacterium]
LDEQGLPLRLTLDISFPAGEIEKNTASIKTSFAGFGQAITLQDILRPDAAEKVLAAYLSPEALGESVIRAVILAICVLMVFLLATLRRHKAVYTIGVIIVILTMVLTPLFKSRQVLAFSREMNQNSKALSSTASFTQPAINNMGKSLLDANAPLAVAQDNDTAPPAVDQCQDAGRESDQDMDSLSCAQEIALGTDPGNPDTDGDLIPDALEVAGFEYQGNTWYTDPLNHDTNGDGRLDGIECPDRAYTNNWDEYTYSPVDTACHDTDADGTPDVLDYDADGDGAPNDVDLSPMTRLEQTDSFGLVVDGLEANRFVLMDIQIQPAREEHLWWALNVLDWPGGDEQGQIQRKTGNDATYADVHPGGADPRFENGDMRLVPMLEILIPWDSVTLGNLPVREDAPEVITPATGLEQWLDNDKLQQYGVAVKRNDDLGNLLAYVPLTYVMDSQGGARVSFAARMPYRPVSPQWGQAHQMRLVWLVHALTDSCTAQDAIGHCTAWSLNNEQIVQTYYEPFTVAGIAVREDLGVDLAIVYQDPAESASAQEDALWSLADNLESVFLGGRDSNNDGQRDITVPEIARRFDHSTNGSVSVEERWGISNSLSVETHRYSDRDEMVAALMTADVASILDSAFTTSNTPTLLFASEQTYRRAALDQQAAISGNSITLQLDGTNSIVLAAIQWRPYAYQNGAWSNQSLVTYMDNLSQQASSTDAFFDPDAAGNDAETTALKLALLHSYYLSLVQGLTGLVQDGDRILEHDGPVPVDDWRLMHEELATGAKFQGYAKQVVKAAYMLRSWYENRQVEQMMARMGYQTVEDVGGIRRKLDKLFMQIQDQWTGLEASVQARWESMSVAGRTGALVGAGVLVAGIGVGLYCLISSDRDTANKVQIATASLSVVMSTLSVIQTVNKIVKAGATTANLTERLQAAAEEVSEGAKTAAVVGAIVAVGITVGFFIYSMISAGVQAGSLEFDAALANTIATSVALVIMIAIAFIPVVGQLIAVVLGLIDAIISLVCGLAGEDAGSSWICGGITGWLAKGIAWAIFGQHIMIDLDNTDRLETYNFGTSFTADSNGFTQGSNLSYHVSVTNTIQKASFPADALALPYFWQWTDSRAKTSAFGYQVSATQTDVEVSRGDTTWRGDEPWTITETATSGPIPLPEPGLNRAIDDLYLNEGYAVPVQECWGLLIASVCYIRDKTGANNLNLGKNLQYDIFPATLDDFYTLTVKDGGYALAWGQDGALTFPSLRDADGDGMLSKAYGGADPDDSHWDADGDGLSDIFEVQNGTDPDNADTDLDDLLDGEELRLGSNPHLPDSDGDGLTDGEEVEGWLFVYGFDGVTPLKTFVRPNLLQVDVDADNYSDIREKIFGFHPRVPSAGDILTLESTIQESAPGGGYTTSDNYVRPGDQLRYQASVTNHLDERYAQGLLTTEFPPSALSTITPQSFVLHPLDQTILSADIQVATDAPGGLVALTQEAQAQITNPRDLLGAPRIWLVFDEPAGATTFIDSAGIEPAYNAACTGNSCPEAGLAGLVGNAIEFDGVDDYLNIYNFSFNSQVAAISAWIKPDTVDGVHGIVLRGDTTNEHGMSFGIVDGQVWVGGNTGAGWAGNYAGAVSAGEWTHVAVVYREYSTAYWDHHRCDVYVSGEHVETFADCAFQLDGPNYVTHIGKNQAGDTQFFDGIIDDLRIYTHAPTSWHVPALSMGLDQTKFSDDSDYNNAVICGHYCPGHVSGISGQAASFDGHTYLSVGLPGVSFEQYTLAAWVYPADTGSSTDQEPQGVIGVNATTIAASPHLIVVDEKVRTGFATGSELVQYTTGNVLTRSVWNHVAVTFGDPDGRLRVYINGAEVASYDAGTKRPNQGSYFAKMTQVGSAGHLGDFNGSSALRLFNGRLDDVIIYREALIATEINMLYQSGAEAVVLAFDDPPGGTQSSDDPGVAHLQNAADATGLHNATCQGDACPVMGVAGREWRAALFDGENDVVVLDNSKSESFAFSGASPVAFSLAAWVYPRSGGAIVGKFNTGREGSHFLRVMDNGAVEFHREAPPWNLVTPDVIPFNRWTHVAGTYDGATMRIYVNGTLTASTSCEGGIPAAPNTPITIGAIYDHDNLTDWFDGMLDDMRIYRKALSGEEVGVLYHGAPALQIAFDEIQGSTTFIDTANGLNGACSGDACPTAGVKGQVSLAADLDGIDDYLEITDDDATDPGQNDDFTVMLWVKPGPHQPDDGNGDNDIVEKWSGEQAGYPYVIRYLNQNSNDPGKVYAARYDGDHNPEVQSAHTIDDGQFHHVAFVKASDTLYLYLDGELNDSLADTITGNTSNNSPLYIGQRGDGINRFAGTVDELQIYKRALSSFEIQDLFQAQVALVADRQHTYIVVDAQAPMSILRSDHPYRANEPVQLLINASDSQSGVAQVDLAVDGVWEDAPACQDANGAAYCPTFIPSGEGRYQLQTRATDKAGNVETPAVVVIFFVDAHPPALVINAADNDLFSLTPNPDDATSWLLQFSGTSNDPALVSGDPGSGVTLVELVLADSTGAAVQAGIQQATLENGIWYAAYPLYDPAPDGFFTLRARATDGAGNIGDWTEVTIRIDGSPPQADLAFPRVADTAVLSATRVITQAGVILSGIVSDTGKIINSGVVGADVALVSNLPGSPHYNEPVFAGEGLFEHQVVHLPLDDSSG